jgi:transcriptional regulator with XRE-family HTH domain
MSSKKGKITMEVLLGSRLKELREEKGLTQKEVATQLGLHSVTYLHYVKDQREPPLTVLMQMALFFDVSADYLLGLTDEY